MGDLKLQGSSGVFSTPKLPQTRKIDAGVSLEKIQEATANNNLDEMVVKDKSGQRYVTYADELSVKNGKLPKVGEKVNLPFLDEAVTVEHVNDEINEDLGLTVTRGSVPILGRMIANKYGDKGGYTGDDSAIKKISSPLTEVSQKELEWAKSLEKHVTQGGKLKALDKEQYTDIYERYTGKEPSSPKPAPATPSSPPTEEEKQWALALKEKMSEGYKPNAQERAYYDKVMASSDQ